MLYRAGSQRPSYGRTMTFRVESIARNRGRTVCAALQSDGFQGEFCKEKKLNRCTAICLGFENVLYAIRYPLATELFANEKVADATRSHTNLHSVGYGPPLIDLGVAKTFSITIMRLPRWKR